MSAAVASTRANQDDSYINEESTASTSAGHRRIDPSRFGDPPFILDDEQTFSGLFEENPVSALSRAVCQLLQMGSGDTNRLVAARRIKTIQFIIDHMIDSTIFMQRLGANALLTFADPWEILAVTLHGYRVDNHEGRLRVADSLLRRFGTRAWPILCVLAKTGMPECECFVSSIAAMPGVDAEARLRALADLARTTDPSTRERVFDALDLFDREQRIPVLRVLAATGHDDDYATQCAQGILGATE